MYEVPWLENAIPPAADGGVYQPSQCSHYSPLANLTKGLCRAEQFESNIVSCDRWVFKDNERTIVGEVRDLITMTLSGDNEFPNCLYSGLGPVTSNRGCISNSSTNIHSKQVANLNKTFDLRLGLLALKRQKQSLSSKMFKKKCNKSDFGFSGTSHAWKTNGSCRWWEPFTSWVYYLEQSCLDI